MSMLRRLLRFPFALWHRKRLEAELAEEMRLHVEHLAAAREAEGMAPSEAYYAARRQFGTADQFKEELRDDMGWNWADNLTRDIRQAVRSLRRERAFTGAFLATFALCLGANIVIFSLVHAVLLAPLPYFRPEQLVTVGNAYPKYGLLNFVASIPNYYEWKRDIPAFAEVATFQMSSAVIGQPGAPERVPSLWAAPAFYRVLGVQAQLGRLPTEAEGEYGGAANLNIVVISDGFWRQQFSADPNVVGRTVSIDGQPNTVIGVLPKDFHFYGGNAAIWGVQRWPANMKAGSRHWNGANVIARLRPGVTIEQAQAQIDALNAHLAKTDPRADWAKAGGFRSVVRGIHAAQVADIRDPLLLLQGGALLLLFVGVVSLVNLLTVRACARRSEMALRRALGATTRNMVMQALHLTAFLVGIGTLVGLGLSFGGLRLLTWLGSDRLPFGAEAHLSTSVVVVSLGGAALLALVFAVPLVACSLGIGAGQDPAAEARKGTVPRPAPRLRHALIVAQIALAFVLVTGAGMLGLSFRRLLAVDPGFAPQRLTTARINLPWSQFSAGPSRRAFIDRWIAGAEALPGVEAAALGTSLPVIGDHEVFTTNMTAEGHQAAAGEVTPTQHVSLVSAGYFAALGISLRQGRLLTAADSQGPGRVCVVDADFARRFWPGRDAVGRRVAIGGKLTEQNALRVVGVVGSVKQKGLSEKDGVGMLYLPFRDDSDLDFALVVVVRSSQAPEILIPEMRKVLLAINGLLTLDDVKTMEVRIGETVLYQRALMLISVLFAALALLLAAVGVYGMTAYAVEQRRREIGVRVAIGAAPARILVQFLRIGGLLAFAGVVLGTAAGLAIIRLIRNLLFNVSPSSPAVFLSAAGILGAAILAASLLPARRAAAVSVMESLRCE